MDIKDTIEGEIYTCYDNAGKLFVYTCGRSNIKSWVNFISNLNGPGHYGSTYTPQSFSWEFVRESTPQEKHWLKECIRLDKGIPFPKAMETFNGEPTYEIY